MPAKLRLRNVTVCAADCLHAAHAGRALALFLHHADLTHDVLLPSTPIPATRPHARRPAQPPEPTAAILAAQPAAAHAQAVAAATTAVAQEAAATTLRTATGARAKPAAKSAIDALWASIYTTYKQVQEMELAWNELSPQVAGE